MVNEYHHHVILFHQGMDRIQKECDRIALTTLIRVDHDIVYEGSMFELAQAEQREKGKEIIQNCLAVIAKELESIFQQFQEGSGDVQREWISHVKKI